MTPRIDRHDTRVFVRDQRASRIADSERDLQWHLLKLDAPFVFTVVSESVACPQGSANPARTDVYVSRTEFPTARLYINNMLVSSQPQRVGQGQLADFIVHGGTTYHATGHGLLAPRGDGLSWIQSGATTMVVPRLGAQDRIATRITRAHHAYPVSKGVVSLIRNQQVLHRPASWLRPSFSVDRARLLTASATGPTQGQSVLAPNGTRLDYHFKLRQQVTYKRQSTLRMVTGGGPTLIVRETDTITDRVVHVDQRGWVTLDETGRIATIDGLKRSPTATNSVILARRRVMMSTAGGVDTVHPNTPFILGDLLLGTLPGYPLRTGTTWSTQLGHASVQHVLTGYTTQQGQRIALIRSTLHNHAVDNLRGSQRRTTVDETEVVRFAVAAGRLLMAETSATVDLEIRIGTATALHSHSTELATVRLVPIPLSHL